MKQNTTELISNELSSFQPSIDLVSKALRHLSDSKREQLFSKHQLEKYSAIGKLYEYVLYEKLSELSVRHPCLNLIGKGADAPSKLKKAPKLKQDGLYYDLSGDVVARGNGQDLAEFDMILTNMNEIVFVEVKTSKVVSNDFNRLIRYKKRLLSHMFNQPISFLLFSSFDIKHNPSIISTIDTKNDLFVKTFTREDLCKLIKNVNITTHFSLEEKSPNPLLSDFDVTTFDYKKIHNSCRKKVINAILHDKPVNFGVESSLIKRLLLGKLSNDSVIELLSTKGILCHEKNLDLKTYHRLFSKIVLSLSIPDLRPTLYMKGVKKSLYLKMGPDTPLIFGFERNIFPRTAFYDWLNAIQHELKPSLVNQIMSKCLTPELCGSRKKFGQKSKISW